MGDSLPIDIVLIRHGESEGNIAQEASKMGDDSLWIEEFRERHTSNYRLTDLGRKQALVAAKWIKENIDETFDAYFCSEYIRAIETAALLDFPHSRWSTEFYLREKDRGILGGVSKQERENEFSDLLKKMKRDAFYVAPPGGESVASSCLRVDAMLNSWRGSHAGQKILVVCHGNIMNAFRVRLEGISASRYEELEKEKTYNCQIFWFSRRNPETGYIHGSPTWARSICPWDLTLSPNVWQKIYRTSLLTTEQLFAQVKLVPQLINTKDLDKVKKQIREENGIVKKKQKVEEIPEEETKK